MPLLPPRRRPPFRSIAVARHRVLETLLLAGLVLLALSAFSPMLGDELQTVFGVLDSLPGSR